VLAGHSFGGMIVRMYASQFRNETSAVVLIDSAFPNQDDRLPGIEKSNAQFLRKQTLKKDTMFVGLPSLMGWCGAGPPAIGSALRTVDCGPPKQFPARSPLLNRDGERTRERSDE